MRKNGFTLIELLAVIVILAIIALIATPIILGIIKNSKDNANKRSIDNYAKALENTMVKYQLSGKKLEEIIMKTTDGRNFSNVEDFKVEYEGSVVCKIIEVYKDGKVYLDKCEVNDEPVEYTYGIDQSYDNGEVVYFDVKEGIGCTEEEYKKSYDESRKDYLNSSTGYNGLNPTKNQTNCLKFYAFLDDGGDKINLLLDHTLSYLIPWNSIISTLSGPNEILSQLKKDTDEWKGTVTPKNYSLNQINQISKANYVIKYKDEGYKARLITANEVAQITGADKALDWDERTSLQSDEFYFDGKKGSDSTWKTQVVGTGKEQEKSDYYWLYDRTDACIKYGCTSELSTNQAYGYWTSSACADHPDMAWAVSYFGSLQVNQVPLTRGYGAVRPVIELEKSKL